MLVLTVPAHARQQTTVSGDCGSVSVSETSSGSSSVRQSASADGGSCAIQQSSSTGGDVFQSIRQVQTTGDGVRRARRHRDRNDGPRADRSNDEEFTAARADELDCEDFSSQSAAQARLEEDSSDPHNLDSDNDGRACEESFRASVRSTDDPRGGIETGGGGTLHTEPARSSDIPMHAPGVAILGAVLAPTLVGAGVFGLRRTRRR